MNQARHETSAMLGRWTFFGRRLPKRIPLKIETPETTSEVVEFELRYRIRICIADAQLISKVFIEKAETDIHTIRNMVASDVRSITDLVGYLHGATFDVDIISAAHEDGAAVVFGTAISDLKGVRTGNLNEIESDLLSAILNEVHARMALANFREAILSPVDSAFFCYRAVETIMQSMKMDQASRNDVAGWEALRMQLQISRPAIDAIKAHAAEPRHGKNNVISGYNRGVALRLTDEIITRYIAYLRNGKAMLAESEFTELTLVSSP